MTTKTKTKAAGKTTRKVTVARREYRAGTIEKIHDGARADPPDIGNGQAENRLITVAFSSESPVRQLFGTEILDHGTGAADLEFLGSGRAPLLADHDRRRQIGVVERAWIDARDRVGRAEIRFGRGEDATAFWNDVVDGIRANISVGYTIDRMVLEEAGDDEDETFRVTNWTPKEISLVSVPADTSVGIGRGEDSETEEIEVEVMKTKEQQNDDTARDDANASAAAQTTRSDDRQVDNGGQRQAQPARPAADTDDAVRRAREDETNRIRAINTIGEEFSLADEARQAIDNGTSADEFRKIALDKIKTRSGSEPIRQRRAEEGGDARIGLSGRDVQNYSIVRAVRAVMFPNERRFQEEAAFERECSAAAGEARGTPAQGILIPYDVLRQPGFLPDQQRASMTVANTTAAGNLVGTDLVAGSFIDLLRNQSAVLGFGAMVLDGLVGDIAIPRQSGASTAYWVGEDVDVTESNLTVDQVTMSPKTVGARQSYSRKLMLQSSPGIEGLVRADLVSVVGLELDRVCLYGSGSGAEPQGIDGMSGVGSVTFAAAVPTFAELLELKGAVAVDNALRGSLGYILESDTYADLEAKPRDTGSGLMCINDNGSIGRYPARESNQVTTEDVWFGNWSDVIVGLWSGIDLTVDPYTNAQSGNVRVVALQDTDVNARHGESFAKGNDGV